MTTLYLYFIYVYTERTFYQSISLLYICIYRKNKDYQSVSLLSLFTHTLKMTTLYLYLQFLSQSAQKSGHTHTHTDTQIHRYTDRHFIALRDRKIGIVKYV